MTPISSEELREKLIYAAEWSEPEFDVADPNLLRDAAAYISTADQRIAELEAANEQLRLAICGGEDAPGYAASIPLAHVLKVARDNYRSWRDASDSAMSAQSEASRWKAEAEGAREALRPFAQRAAEVDRDGKESFDGGKTWRPLADAHCVSQVRLGWLRAARAFLSQHSEGEK